MARKVKFDEFLTMLKVEYKYHGETELFNKGVAKIIEKQNPEYAFRAAKDLFFVNRGYDFSSLKQVAIDLKSDKYCYEFAFLVKEQDDDANIRDLQDIVIEGEDAEYNYEVAKLSDDEYLYKHSKVVLKNGNPHHNECFARLIAYPEYSSMFNSHRQAVINSKNPHANLWLAAFISNHDDLPPYLINEHSAIVQKYGDAACNLDFIQNVKSADKLAHAKVIIDSKDGEMNYRCMALSNDYGLNFKEHERALIASKDVNWIMYATRSLAGVDIRACGKAIIEDGDPFKNYEFASIPGADVKAHERVVIESENAGMCYSFAKDIKGANVLALGEVVMDSESAHFNKLFALNIPGADVVAHANVVEKYGSYEDKKEFAENKPEEWMQRDNDVVDLDNALSMELI